MTLQSESATFDARGFRDVLGCFATGVTVVTTVGEGGAPVGLAVNSFSSVSLDPPLVLWSIAKSAASRPAFRAHGGFAINVMGASSKECALQFARPAANKFDGVAWRPGLDGLPVLEDAVATLECRIEKYVEGGDHEILIGLVRLVSIRDGAPLIFHRGRFAEIGQHI